LRQLAGSACRCKPSGHVQHEVIDFGGRHALSCPKFSKQVARHDYIKKQWAALFEEAGFNVMVEPSSWARVAARIAAWQKRRAHPHDDARVGEGGDGVGGDGEADDGEVLDQGEQIRPDIVVLGAGPNGQSEPCTGRVDHDDVIAEARGARVCAARRASGDSSADYCRGKKQGPEVRSDGSGQERVV